jgi:transposase
MRKALPVITEALELLKQRLQREYDGRKKPRLQMLYLLASGRAQTRQDVAQLLGVHRNTMGHWLAIYEAGGLMALLDVYRPPGKPVSLPPEVLAALEQALRQPAGFASYEALRQWVKQTHHLEVNYHTLYTIVRKRFKAKLKVPRPSHTKKPRRPASVSSHLSGAAAARHSAGEYPTGARVQPR